MDEDQALPLPRDLTLGEVDSRRGKPSKEDIVSALYEALRPSMLSYAYHLIGSTRDAEDLVQIAFLQLFDQLSYRSDIKNRAGFKDFNDNQRTPNWTVVIGNVTAATVVPEPTAMMLLGTGLAGLLARLRRGKQS